MQSEVIMQVHLEIPEDLAKQTIGSMSEWRWAHFFLIEKLLPRSAGWYPVAAQMAGILETIAL